MHFLQFLLFSIILKFFLVYTIWSISCLLQFLSFWASYYSFISFWLFCMSWYFLILFFIVIDSFWFGFALQLEQFWAAYVLDSYFLPEAYSTHWRFHQMLLRHYFIFITLFIFFLSVDISAILCCLHFPLYSCI